ncbi:MULTISPECIES: PfkB family carbohydrate kinase [Nonomuraea]|uniref:PfkB family carbohydrate kinase n=2 Tax=Nonomuraea ferruginea TaxID=46174 RepID=A0ABT4SW53_9ACTN|nr:PfkB family carbohydrate kinase [Nonomuraea ferruginea]MDA0641472.1 PfkB family carbohydrate kinase [Nonomuraea ferruginea]
MTTRMCGVGDNVVDRYLHAGLMYPGGSAANVAVHSRRLGATAGYLGVLGDDEAAAHVLKALLAEDVDVTRVRHRAEPNSFADVTLDDEGNRFFGTFQPPVTRIELEDRDLAYLSGCDWVHTGHSSFTVSEVPKMHAVTAVAYDFSYQGLDVAAPVLPFVTAAMFSRADDTEAECLGLVEEVRGLGPDTVVVTRGTRGSIVWRRGELVVQPAVPARAVDTLGAGDAYFAALMCGLSDGLALPDATARAAAYAAAVCEHFGAFGHPTAISDSRKEAAR